MRIDSVTCTFITYFLRGFGFPLFAFAFLVWINAVVPLKRNGTAVGMFVLMPAVISTQLGWGQSRWPIMTTVICASNILLNAVFGAIGDRWGWARTVRWFGVMGSTIGLLAWWYVPHWVPHGSVWGYYVSLAAGVSFGTLLAGFVPPGAILPALTPDHKGAAMAMSTTAAGGATFLGTAVVAVVKPWGGNVGVIWAFVALYAASFIMTWWLEVDQNKNGRDA